MHNPYPRPDMRDCLSQREDIEQLLRSIPDLPDNQREEWYESVYRVAEQFGLRRVLPPFNLSHAIDGGAVELSGDSERRRFLLTPLADGVTYQDEQELYERLVRAGFVDPQIQLLPDMSTKFAAYKVPYSSRLLSDMGQHSDPDRRKYAQELQELVGREAQLRFGIKAIFYVVGDTWNSVSLVPPFLRLDF